MWKLALLWVAGMLWHANVLATEHPACNDPGYPFWVHAAPELRMIAGTCRSAQVARLYFLRAYHADLVSEGRVLAGLIPYDRRQSNVEFDSYKIYMALVETMTPLWFSSNSDRTEFLNAEYTRHTEIAEMRLHGYDRLADHLEQN